MKCFKCFYLSHESIGKVETDFDCIIVKTGKPTYNRYQGKCNLVHYNLIVETMQFRQERRPIWNYKALFSSLTLLAG